MPSPRQWFTPARRRPNRFRPAVESLEDRLTPAAGLPDIVVGRTLSTYTTGGVQDHTLTVTYTVYNEQADDVSGVLLTTTLQPGIDVQSASSAPNRNGQELAWSLGTLPAFGRASVAVTVRLPDLIPLQIDGGAKAFGTLNAGAVSDTTPAAALVNRVIPADQLASTADANTADPFVQEQAAKLDYDPQAIFDYLNNDVGYESYVGSLRGARGTLWGQAGNSLDEASLGVALFRASGIPARYAHGTLSDPLSRQLILAMFPASYQTVGYTPPGTATADPANDPQLLAETRDHYWLQVDTGAGFQNADTSGLPGGGFGTAFTAATTTFAEVADGLRHKVRVSLDAEMYSQAVAAFAGGSGLGTTTVLDETFNAVELVGVPLSVGNLVTATGLGALFLSSTTFTYAPYIRLGDGATPGDDTFIRGTDYQEVYTNFPLGSQVLTGLSLQLSFSTPQINGPAVTSAVSKTLYDRIGFAARNGGVAVAVNTGATPTAAVSSLDIVTLQVSGQTQNIPQLLTQNALVAQLAADNRQLATQLAAPSSSSSVTVNQLNAATRGTVTETNALLGERFLVNSDLAASSLAPPLFTKLYFDSPRVVAVSSSFALHSATNSGTLTYGMDILRDSPRVVVGPNQTAAARETLAFVHGYSDSVIEGGVLNPNTATQGVQSSSAMGTLQQAFASNVGLAVIASANVALVGQLAISAEARARITAAAANGRAVLVPVESVLVNGRPTIAWLEIDPATGNAIAVAENGTHGSVLTGTAGAYDIATTQIAGAQVAGTEVAAVTAAQVAADEGGILIVEAAEQQALRLAAQQGIKGPAVRQFVKKEVAAALFDYDITISQTIIQATFELGVLGNTIQLYFKDNFVKRISNIRFWVMADPPLSDLVGAATISAQADSIAVATVSAPASAAPGAVAGTLNAANIQATGSLDATWQSTATNSFAATTLTSASATVHDDAGQLVGSGNIALSAGNAVPLAIAGTNQYRVNGNGSLSFYGAAESALGVGADWVAYTATVTGTGLTINLRSAGLTLNGQPLPEGTYTITTAAATVTGSGATSSPTFSGSATVGATSGAVDLGPANGSLTVGGTPLNPGSGATLGGYTGSIVVTAAAGDTDNVTLNGSAATVLSVSTTPGALTADQNTSVTFKANVSTSFADDYSLTVQAPKGWAVTVDISGNVTATPAPGLQGGTYPIQIVARSTANPDLVAQTTVSVTITPTAPGVTLAVDPDPLFTVPFEGAQVPAAFEALVHNTGPAADTYNLTVTNIPAGFNLLRSSGANLVIPAGQTGVVGLYLEPTAGTPLPAPGTVVAFTVTATSTTDPNITQTRTVTFTVPAIRAVTAASTPTAIIATPGLTAQASLDLHAVGNVAENIELTLVTSTGITVTGLPATVALSPGQSRSIPLTVAVGSGVPLNSDLGISITVKFGPDATTQTTRVVIPVRVVVPGADAIGTAATAAAELGDADLAARLTDLSLALTNLVQDPASAVFKSQALASLASIRTLLLPDPILATFAGPLSDAADGLTAAQTATQVQASVIALGGVLDDFAATVAALRHSRVEVSLTPNSVVAQPGVPQQFDILLHNVGDQTTTYDLSLLGLPAGVTGGFSQPSVTLAPGQFSAGLSATLTQTSGDELQAFEFRVKATAAAAPLVSATAVGTLRSRKEVVSVVSVGLSPRFVNAGGQVAVSARVLNAVNRQQEARAYFEVRDSLGAIQYISPDTPVTLGVVQSLTTLDLGTFDTTGYADGEYAVTVILLDAAGNIIPGAIQDARLFVGSPVASTVDTNPATLPPGTSTVTTAVTVGRGASAAGEFQLVGQLAIADALTFANVGRYRGTFNGTAYNLLYVGGSNAFYVVDVSDPANPTLIRSKGGRATALAVDGTRVVTIDQGPGNLNPFFSSGTLSTFSLSTGAIFPVPSPANPTSIGQLNFDYQAAGGPLVSGDVVYAAVQNLFYTVADGNVFHTQGDVIAFDISDLQNPRLLGVLDNTFGTTRDAEGINSGGPNAVFNLARADATTLYAASTTYTIQNDVTTPGVGVVRIVDVSNPAAMSQVGVFTVPNTTFATGLTVVGNRAYVVGSEGGWFDPLAANNDAGPAGRIVITTLDITNPRHPVLLGQSTLDRSARLAGSLVDLGGGHFALASAGLPADTPKLYELDLTTPGALQIVRETDLTDTPFSVSTDGEFVYVADAVGVKVFALAGGSDVFTSVQVLVPKGTGVAVVPGSFNVAPTNVIVGTDYDTLVWDVTLTDAVPGQTFTFQSTVTGLQPGEARDVTVGTAINFDFGGTPGLVTQPATSVAAEQVLGISPAAQTVRPGERADYTLTVANPGAVAVTYDLSVRGVPRSWVTIPARVTVPAGGSVAVPVEVMSDPNAPVADYAFVVTVAVGGTHGSVEAALTLLGAPLVAPPQPQSRGVVVEVLPAVATAGQGTSVGYRVRVTNTGSETETFTLAVTTDLPADVAAALASNSALIPPGADNFREFVVVLTPRAGAPAGVTGFTAVVTSPTTTASARGSLTVVANGVDVKLDHATGTPGDTFQVTVTNTGSVADTFDLSAAGPGGLVAALGTARVSLAAGASVTIPLTTGLAPFAVQGNLGLTVVARSTGNPAVADAADAALQIAPTTGLAARFDPAARTLSAPGQTDFLLRIDNTGNTEEGYSITLTGTTGPVSAWLIGPDGLPTQQISDVRLPGLSSGTVLVRATLAAIGTAGVTVEVRSLDTPALVTKTTATLKADPIVPSAPVTASPPHLFAVGAGPGDVRTGSHVKAFDTDGGLRLSFFAYDAGFFGGVTVATADVNGDGFDDIVTGTATAADHVKVFDGRTGIELASFLAFGGYRGGVTVAAAGGLIAVGAGAGSQPHVKLFRYVNGEFREVGSFLAFDAGFAGGVSVGLDGSTGRLVVGAGVGAQPHVKVFDAGTLSLLGSFLAFDAGFAGGVWVTAHAGLVGVGAGAGGAGHVKVFDEGTLAERASFRAGIGGQAHVGGAVGPGPLLLTGAGPGTSPRVGVYADAAPRLVFDAFDASFLGGVFVG